MRKLDGIRFGDSIRMAKFHKTIVDFCHANIIFMFLLYQYKSHETRRPLRHLGYLLGATTSEVKEAYQKLARKLHPDVNPKDEAKEKFQRVQKAYEAILGKHTNDNEEEVEQWIFRNWRKGDLIAQQRTDVAGEMRKRPIRPVTMDVKMLKLGLGHPDGSGSYAIRKNEFLSDGNNDSNENQKQPRRVSSSVGTGLNKWVSKKEFQPWKPSKQQMKARACVDRTEDDV